MSNKAKYLQDTILDKFKTGWGSTSPVAWPNIIFNPDTGSITKWVRITVIESVTANADVGGTLRRTVGNIFVQVFVTKGNGTSDMTTLCDAVLNVLEQKNFGTYIETGRGSVAGVGGDPKSAWWQANVVIPFRFDSQT